MEMERPRIILLGSNGFLGSQIFADLKWRGYNPRKATSDLSLLENNFSRSDFDSSRTILISMAWTSNSKGDYLNNPENSIWAKKHIEFAKFCLKNNYFFVVAGSCLEYGNNTSTKYVKSKIQLREFLEENVPAKEYLWLRYFYVFSLAHRRPGLIRDALKALDSSKPLLLDNIKGNHDFIELRDATGQTIELIEGLNHGVWDIGTGRTRSNLEFLSKIKDLNIIESEKAEGFSKTRISWEGAANKLIPNHAQFTVHTNQYFGTLAL